MGTSSTSFYLAFHLPSLENAGWRWWSSGDNDRECERIFAGVADDLFIYLFIY